MFLHRVGFEESGDEAYDRARSQGHHLVGVEVEVPARDVEQVGRGIVLHGHAEMTAAVHAVEHRLDTGDLPGDEEILRVGVGARAPARAAPGSRGARGPRRW